MKTLLTLKWGIFVIGVLALTNTLTHAQTTANGPYYATPSWDQTLPSATRFIVLSNFNSQAVLDRETGLVWQRSPLGDEFVLREATRLCLESRVGNRGGWRLPTINELTSVLDPSATAGPALPPGHPFVGFNPSAERLWSATPNALSGLTDTYKLAGWSTLSSGVLVVALAGDASSLVSGKAWCVRGGLQSGAQ
jgi:hypothetical protein